MNEKGPTPGHISDHLKRFQKERKKSKQPISKESETKMADFSAATLKGVGFGAIPSKF